MGPPNYQDEHIFAIERVGQQQTKTVQYAKYYTSVGIFN